MFPSKTSRVGKQRNNFYRKILQMLIHGFVDTLSTKMISSAADVPNAVSGY